MEPYQSKQIKNDLLCFVFAVGTIALFAFSLCIFKN